MGGDASHWPLIRHCQAGEIAFGETVNVNADELRSAFEFVSAGEAFEHRAVDAALRSWREENGIQPVDE